MNLKETKALRGDEIRLKIAELLGWKDLRVDQHGASTRSWEVIGTVPWAPAYPEKGMDYHFNQIVPYFPEDLNACHKMEKALKPRDPSLRGYSEIREYLRVLKEICRPSDPEFATARQRCEAFILAKRE